MKIFRLNALVLNSQHAGTGATWRINAKILSTCRGWRHIVSPSSRLVNEKSAQRDANTAHWL